MKVAGGGRRLRGEIKDRQCSLGSGDNLRYETDDWRNGQCYAQYEHNHKSSATIIEQVETGHPCLVISSRVDVEVLLSIGGDWKQHAAWFQSGYCSFPPLHQVHFMQESARQHW